MSGRNLATSSAQPAVSLLTEKNHPSGSTTTSKRSFDTSIPQKESMAIPSFQYSPDRPRVITYIQLDYARFLSFETIRDFFATIAMHSCYESEASKEYFEAQQAIDRAMTEALWRSNEVDVYGFYR